jgi:MYXO-CTERM domain-containing protein
MQMELYKLPLTDAIIPIPGIEGGFQLEGQGEFFAQYETLRIAFDELTAKDATPDVDPMKSFTRVLFSSAPALDTSLFIHGELQRQLTLHFIPGFYFEILGKKFDLELLDVPVPIPKTTKAWDFDPVSIHFPLPRIEAKPNPIDLGTIPVGQATPILVTAFDTGEAKLVIDASDPTSVLTIDTKHLEIGGGSSDAVRATITPTAAGPIDTTLLLESNDPLKPKLSIRITANGAGSTTGDDPNTEAAGGCGCHTPASAALSPKLGAISLLALVSLRRRKRTRSQRSHRP